MGDFKIQSYRDLRVWQEAVNLVETCYRLTKTFPKEEIYGITSQIRRASVNTIRLRIFVGWVEQSETQQIPVNVGFRSSTQPTYFCFLALTEQYWSVCFNPSEYC